MVQRREGNVGRLDPKQGELLAVLGLLVDWPGQTQGFRIPTLLLGVCCGPHTLVLAGRKQGTVRAWHGVLLAV